MTLAELAIAGIMGAYLMGVLWLVCDSAGRPPDPPRDDGPPPYDLGPTVSTSGNPRTYYDSLRVSDTRSLHSESQKQKVPA